MYLGHLFLRVALDEKQATLADFWTWTPAQQATFLRDRGVTHVVITTADRTTYDAQAEAAWAGQRVYENATVVIYAVEGQ